MKLALDGVETTCVRVLIADDHCGWRAMLQTALSREPGLEVIAEAGDGLEAVQRATDASPDLVLMDLSMPVMNGIQATARILSLQPACRVLMLTEARTPEIAAEALRTGATGYVIKSNAEVELIPAIQTVLDGGVFVSESIRIAANGLGIEPGVESESDRRNPFAEHAASPAIQGFLELVVRASRADFGSLQLFDSDNNVLRMVAHFGFDSEFVEHFKTVAHENYTLCSRAMAGRRRVVANDILDYAFASRRTRDVMLRANVRSCQATPLLCNICGFMGVVSTHYARPGGPAPEVLPEVDHLAKDFIANVCG